MPDEPAPPARACELVGLFFYHFSRVEQQLDAAITKLFNLDPIKEDKHILSMDDAFLAETDEFSHPAHAHTHPVDAEIVEGPAPDIKLEARDSRRCSNSRGYEQRRLE